MVDPPSVPDDLLTDWRRADDTTETLFSAAGVTVTARLLRYEDDYLRARIRERAGVDRSWRFFLAARLELTPQPPVTGALRGLVAAQASRGFANRLGDRGFDAVDRVERRMLRIGDHEARLFGYDSRCPVDSVTLSVDGWLAVWAPDRAFRLAGGAYPTGVVDATDDETADALRDCLDPSAFRSDLFALLRGIA
ncbi:hypothetical protein [Haloplanus aerogenes]|uniref:Uncharacterized protein n=1 Tax=Haloplanus aerogenes TaxID=660522 RepID=A0A3M0DV02_9EURY|nr:hypothetical protein [Haloplanus aerogenes]RMB25635.1 hypothetical protein ATH50_0732 [Haloplanus aerogenes]